MTGTVHGFYMKNLHGVERSQCFQDWGRFIELHDQYLRCGTTWDSKNRRFDEAYARTILGEMEDGTLGPATWSSGSAGSKRKVRLAPPTP